MNISEILEKGFTPVEQDELIHYRLDIEHLLFDGLHIIIHVKHEIIILYGRDIQTGVNIPFYECLLTEKNLTELLNYLKNESKI